MTSEHFLNGIKHSVEPSDGAQLRIRQNLQSKLSTESPLLLSLHDAMTPKKTLQKTVWNRILPSVELPQADTFTRIKIALQSSEELKEKIKLQVLRSLEPIHAVARGPMFAKWTAAFVVVGLLIKISPFLFIASSTMADSQALLIPTRGEVSVSIGGLWQKLDQEMVLEPGMMIHTHDGEVTLAFNDDGAVRLAPETTVTVQDTANRLEPASEMLPTLTLEIGEVWIQGLTPQPLRPLVVKTRDGLIAINEGSASIAVRDTVDIEVYDRSAVVYRKGEPTFLASGERTRLSDDSVLLVKKIPAKWYQYTWANQNLDRDAVHRHDIAQLQHERRIAGAGILPTSPIYPVKRFAELMNVWMTWGQQTRVEKQLQVAETRLNEAAALIYNGKEATVSLDEYRSTLQQIAAGKNNGSLAEFLVQRAIAQSTSHMSAALPGDESYVIKKTVLEASDNLGEGLARDKDAQGTLLLDGLAVMLRSVDQGNTDAIAALWADMQPYLRTLESEELTLGPSMHKEAQTLLTFLATSLHLVNSRGANIDPELLDDIAAYLPVPKDLSVIVMSEDEIMEIVQRIREKIFIYNMTQSRVNQFVSELKALEGHPDLGRILRRMAIVLPDGPESFPDRVYKEIVRLRWEKAGDTI